MSRAILKSPTTVCKRGHFAERYISTGDCVVCVKERRDAWNANNDARRLATKARYYAETREIQIEKAKAWRLSNYERALEKDRRYYAENKEARAEKNREYRRANAEKLKSAARARYERNKGALIYYHSNKEKCAARSAEWRRANPHLVRAKTRRRNATKVNATPAWLTDAHHAEMANIYRRAVEMSAGGVRHEVDHIVPLRGRNVCGLHVPWNLQILDWISNRSKGNKLEVLS